MIRKQSKRSILIDCVINNEKRTSKNERKQNTKGRIGQEYAVNHTEIPPFVLNGGMYRSDSRTLPPSVRKIPFLKTQDRQKGG